MRPSLITAGVIFTCAATVLIMAIRHGMATSSSPDSDASPHLAWLRVPKSTGEWNREKLLIQILSGRELNGVQRDKILQLLGPPGYSAVSYPQLSRSDAYRLSSANRNTFWVDYDANGTVTEDRIDASPCTCDECDVKLPWASSAAARNLSLARDIYTSTVTLASLEKAIGRPGRMDSVENTVGGQVWVNYSDSWRVVDEPHTFLIASGHIQFTKLADSNSLLKQQRITSWGVVSFARVRRPLGAPRLYCAPRAKGQNDRECFDDAFGSLALASRNDGDSCQHQRVLMNGPRQVR